MSADPVPDLDPHLAHHAPAHPPHQEGRNPGLGGVRHADRVRPITTGAPEGCGCAGRRRGFIGIEASPEYANVARKRIAAVQPMVDATLVTTPGKRTEARIPFGWVVERGLLNPGDILFDDRRRWTAKVRADGQIVTADFTGSIHQAGAHVQSASTCNGWTFWNFDAEGKAVSIDVLRQQIRAELAQSNLLFEGQIGIAPGAASLRADVDASAK